MRASAVGLSPSPTRVTMLRSQSRSGYYWPTPNGGKISIVLEECGLPYDLRGDLGFRVRRDPAISRAQERPFRRGCLFGVMNKRPASHEACVGSV